MKRLLACVTDLLWMAATATLAAETTRAAADQPLPQVRFETNRGTFDVELYPKRSPATVAQILTLVDARYYDNLIFHRVIANFMIQTGGFDKDLRYREPPQQIVNESPNGLFNRPGYLAMARTDDPDSAAAQFFINLKNNFHLNAQRGSPGYTVFGKVTNGWEVIEDIAGSDTSPRQGISAALPDIPVIILRARRL